jgi:hypothetical protein
LIICFDRRKSDEKTKYNHHQLHPYGIVFVDDNKHAFINLNQIEIRCGDSDETYEIVVTISDGKNKTLNTNKASNSWRLELFSKNF